MEGQWDANERRVAEIKAIANSKSYTPVLMININKYNKVNIQTAKPIGII